MIKATTINGTYYLIDYKENRAKRVKGTDRHTMHGDNDWFLFSYVVAYPIEDNMGKELPKVGKSMYFKISGIDTGPYDWRLSTQVVSIEEIAEIVEPKIVFEYTLSNTHGKPFNAEGYNIWEHYSDGTAHFLWFIPLEKVYGLLSYYDDNNKTIVFSRSQK
jgi:hypothetical protein